MFYLISKYCCHIVVRSLFHVTKISKVAVKLVWNVSYPCPQSHLAVAARPHFLRFDWNGGCPGVRLSLQARTSQSHMEQSATPTCGCIFGQLGAEAASCEAGQIDIWLVVDRDGGAITRLFSQLWASFGTAVMEFSANWATVTRHTSRC